MRNSCCRASAAVIRSASVTVLRLQCSEIANQIHALLPFLRNSVPCPVEMHTPEDIACASGEELLAVRVIGLVCYLEAASPSPYNLRSPHSIAPNAHKSPAWSGLAWQRQQNTPEFTDQCEIVEDNGLQEICKRLLFFMAFDFLLNDHWTCLDYEHNRNNWE